MQRPLNPVRQNMAHARAIEDLLGARRLKRPIFSLVVFPYADKLVISGTDSVVFAHDLVKAIRSRVHPVLSDVERDEIYDAIASANIVDKSVRRDHERRVKELKWWRSSRRSGRA